MISSALPFHVAALSGSPSAESRSAALLRFVERRLAAPGVRTRHLELRDLPAVDLLHGRAETPALQGAIAAVREANLVLVATPIYKSSFSGLLKSFLDLLPTDALRGKAVLPLATGGSLAHLLALEYALKPVLGALGARDWLDPVYVTDDAWRPHETFGRVPDAEVAARIDNALEGWRRLVREPVAASC